MSNSIYGFIELPELVSGKKELLSKLESLTGLGFVETDFKLLHGFTSEQTPHSEDRAIAFCIGDKPGKADASYLIDYVDYVEGGNIGMPLEGKERLELLIEAVKTIFSIYPCNRLCLAITDSCEVESYVELTVDKVSSQLHRDFAEYEGPTGTVYTISR